MLCFMEPVQRRARVRSTMYEDIFKNSCIVDRTELEYYRRQKEILHNEITEISGRPRCLYMALQVDSFGVG